MGGAFPLQERGSNIKKKKQTRIRTPRTARTARTPRTVRILRGLEFEAIQMNLNFIENEGSIIN